jgi:hypothetical protein
MSLTKLTGQVMADDIASAVYASLGDHIPPGILADNYLQAKLAGNKSECLALELYLRQATARYCHVSDYRDALAAVDGYKAMRKPGNGGARIYQDIARAIELAYAEGDYIGLPDGRIKFQIGSLAVTCRNMPGAVQLVCAKYRRGLPKDGAGRYGTANRP